MFLAGLCEHLKALQRAIELLRLVDSNVLRTQDENHRSPAISVILRPAPRRSLCTMD